MNENSDVDVQRIDAPDPEAETARRTGDRDDAAIGPQDSDGATGAAATPAGDTAEPKTAPATRRDFEHALREQLGFSRRQAAAIAAGGFKARGAEEDEAEQHQALRAALDRLAGALKDTSWK